MCGGSKLLVCVLCCYPASLSPLLSAQLTNRFHSLSFPPQPHLSHCPTFCLFSSIHDLCPRTHSLIPQSGRKSFSDAILFNQSAVINAKWFVVCCCFCCSFILLLFFSSAAVFILSLPALHLHLYPSISGPHLWGALNALLPSSGMTISHLSLAFPPSLSFVALLPSAASSS